MSVNKVNSDGSLLRVAGGTLYADSPIGTILAFGGANAPAGWMICDGTSLLRASYPELFAVIGTAFGSADSTHFNIPDMRESVPKGAGLTGNSSNHMDADGLAVGEFLDDRVQNHRHSINYATSGSGTDGFTNISANISSKTTGSITADSRSGATTEVKSVGVNYIIKAKMVALPADFMSAVDEAVEEKLGWTLLKSQNVADSDSVTFTLPANYNEVLIITGTPVFHFSDIIPFAEMEDAGNYALYHETSMSGGNATQVFDFTLVRKGQISITTIKQNGSANTGNLKIYYR